jgi:hypothetical protein
MKKPMGIVRELTAAELATSLAGHAPTRSVANPGSPTLRSLAPRLLFCASLAAGFVAAPERPAHADVTVQGFAPGTTPAQAYDQGYQAGQTAAALGVAGAGAAAVAVAVEEKELRRP